MAVRKAEDSLVKKLTAKIVSKGLLTKDQLGKAKALASKEGNSLVEALVDLRFIDKDSLLDFIADELEIPRVDLSAYMIEPEVIDLVKEKTARMYRLIPLFRIEDTLTVAMADPVNIVALDDIKLQVGLEVVPAISSEESIEKAINEYYGGAHLIGETIESFKKSGGEDFPTPYDLKTKSVAQVIEQPPIVKLVNQIILEAIKTGASDIHVEPRKTKVDVRYRIDGVLHSVSEVPKHLHLAVVSRLKIMADLDITERRVPQDGRIQRKLGDKEIDLRVSTFNTIYGEKVVLRILDKSNISLDLPSLGFSKESLRRMNIIIKQKSGLVLICGPTGSGKTSTLYAALSAISVPDKNIVTLEEPVEYQIKYINQGQINPKAGLTYAKGLRAILRQDPDIVMVGEVRDFETAELVMRATLTGHLVFSTLHTMDAATTLTRLLDMGVESYLLSSSVSGIVAQRLVRKICDKCKTEYMPTKEVLAQAGWSSKQIKLFKGKGCKACHQTGYKGRIGLFEVVVLDERLRGLISASTPADVIRKGIRQSGTKSLRDEGFDKVEQGITTLEEVLRETPAETGK